MIDFWSALKDILPSSSAIRPSWPGRRPAREFAAPSVTQRLAAIRHLFDWRVTSQVVPVNPAALMACAAAGGDVGGEGGTTCTPAK
jgi:hypothetical protein